MSLRSARSPRKRLLIHLSQAVETLALRRSATTEISPLRSPLEGEVKLQCFEVTAPEFDHFEKISDAIARLDHGTYGHCTRCRNRIEAEILKARPWAALCLECQGQRADNPPRSF